MRGLLVLSLLVVMPVALAAQEPGSLDGGGPGPDLATASVRVERSLALTHDPAGRLQEDLGALRKVSTATAEGKTRADALLSEARRLRGPEQGRELRQRLAEAASLLLDRPWTPDRAAAASLALDVYELVADPARPLHYRLSQVYPAAVPGLTLRMALSTLAAPQRGATPNLPERTAKLFASAPLDPAGPQARQVGLAGLADGDYALEARVYRGGELIGASRAPFRVVNGLLAFERATRARLARLHGRDDTLAAVTYPFDTARAVNGWRRDIPENLDFTAAMARSRTLLAALERGRDPVWQGTGDQYRAYYFGRGGETMPYRLYVPRSWKPGVKLPMVVDLHGGGGNEDMDFRDGRFGGLMQRLAEQHGFIIIAPLGYRPSGGYGVVYGKTVPDRSGVRPTVAAGDNVSTLSEADTMAVISRVATEYGVDFTRIYLVGNSMGGGGVWYIGSKFRTMFAAIAPCGSSMPFDGYDFGNLATMPVHLVVGSLDAQQRQLLAHQAFDALTARGFDATLTVVPDEIHSNAWLAVLPGTFDFFQAHRRPG